jgi:hypothetical protein
MLYTRLLPCTWEVTIPRFFSTARCWETTGCDCSRQAHSSETQASSPFSIAQRIFRRRGCPRAFKIDATSLTFSIFPI